MPKRRRLRQRPGCERSRLQWRWRLENWAAEEGFQAWSPDHCQADRNRPFPTSREHPTLWVWLSGWQEPSWAALDETSWAAVDRWPSSRGSESAWAVGILQHSSRQGLPR